MGPRIRQCTQYSLDMLKKSCQRVIVLLQDLGQRLAHVIVETASPLMLHCVYNCAAPLSWLYLETNNVQYATGKLGCEDMLRSTSRRWKVASSGQLNGKRIYNNY